MLRSTPPERSVCMHAPLRLVVRFRAPPYTDYVLRCVSVLLCQKSRVQYCLVLVFYSSSMIHKSDRSTGEPRPEKAKFLNVRILLF
jgi:hypothetical protein